MKISVAVPCYNGAQYLRRCAEALLAQSRAADEVLIVDDGSTDGSAATVADCPVRLVKHVRNEGLAFARNTALHQATGDIIVYVDADAYADSELLAVIEEEFGDASVAGAGGQGIEAVQANVYDRWRRLHASQGHGPRRLSPCAHLFGLCMAYRRDALLSVGGFDTRFRSNAEDMDIGFRLNLAGYRLVYTPRAVVFHQRRDDHVSLRRAMYNWYYWAFIAKRKNAQHPWSLAAGTVRRLIWSDTWPDLLQRRDPEVVKLDLEMTVVKMRAVVAASRSGPLENQ